MNLVPAHDRNDYRRLGVVGHDVGGRFVAEYDYLSGSGDTDGALHGVGHYMSFVGLFVDMNALGTVVSVLCAYQIALLLIRLILWVYHVVRP